MASRNPETLPALIRRIDEAVTQPMFEEHGEVRVGASIGYAIAERQDESHEAVLGRADHAMYTAKRARTAAMRLSPGWSTGSSTL